MGPRVKGAKPSKQGKYESLFFGCFMNHRGVDGSQLLSSTSAVQYDGVSICATCVLSLIPP